MFQTTMMQHGPGLAASPPVSNKLEVGGEEYSAYVFPRWADNPFTKQRCGCLQRRSAASHSLTEQQTLPQTTAPNHCYAYRCCTILRRSVPIRRLRNADPARVRKTPDDEMCAAKAPGWRGGFGDRIGAGIVCGGKCSTRTCEVPVHSVIKGAPSALE